MLLLFLTKVIFFFIFKFKSLKINELLKVIKGFDFVRGYIVLVILVYKILTDMT